jgi:hypothetical protein
MDPDEAEGVEKTKREDVLQELPKGEEREEGQSKSGLRRGFLLPWKNVLVMARLREGALLGVLP